MGGAGLVIWPAYFIISAAVADVSWGYRAQGRTLHPVNNKKIATAFHPDLHTFAHAQ